MLPLDNKTKGPMPAWEDGSATFAKWSGIGEESVPLYEDKTFPLLGALGMANTDQGRGDALRRPSQETESSVFPA